ncbi:MAG TPA: cytochrome c, partial [Chryseosolibacter sp.]|nr:cytochrome c [Chryseosolibacter sp.]
MNIVTFHIMIGFLRHGMRARKGALVCSFALLVASPVFSQQGETIYKSYCAGCHGSEMQGNTATKLIKTDWQYGRGKGAMVRNIRFGIPNTEMIAWGTVLDDAEIGAVADYIIAAQQTPPNALRPIPRRITTDDYILKVEKLVSEGLNTPWGIEFV